MFEILKKIIHFKMLKIWHGVYIGLFFKWYNMYIGVFVDKDKKKVFICPLPMIVIIVSWGIWYLHSYPKDKEPIYY